LPDLKPFSVDPILLGRFADFQLSMPAAAIGTAMVTGLAVTWSAVSADLFYWSARPRSLWNDVWQFISRRSPRGLDQSVPYLRDYPSIVLTFTIVTSLCLVYGLYRGASTLHSDLEASGCVNYDEAGRAELTKRIDAMNKRLQTWGKVSPLVFVGSIAFTLMTNLTVKSNLFGFLGGPRPYEHWWASIYPLRAGGVVWVLCGGIGIYMVYVEAVLGLTYLNFLRGLRHSGHYQFRANMLNPDGFFGWYRLRQLITNMQAGAVCTLLSAWAFSYFLEPAVGTIATIVILSIFIGIVTYVYFGVNANFRRQVKRDKRAQADAVGREIAELDGRTDPESLLKLLVAYRQLDYIAQIPSAPIRQRWLLAGALSLLGTLTAVVIPLIQYFSSIKL
jgi:hypothetical protein